MDDFSTLGVTEKKGKKVNTAQIQQFKNILEANPEIREKLFSLTDKIEVVGSCSFGELGGVIQLKPAVKVVDPVTNRLVVKKGTREIAQTSKIVGYILRNNSDEAIPYITEIYKEVNGEIVGEVVERMFEPNTDIMLTRKYTTIFCARPEISFKLANATLSRTNDLLSTKSPDALLDTPYIRLKEKGVSVHDADFKIPVAEKSGQKMVNGKMTNIYKVLPRFFETFGYLNNEQKKNERPHREAADNMNQAAIAHYINSMVQKNQKM